MNNKKINKVTWWRFRSKRISLIKAISYRTLSTILSGSIIYYFTKNFNLMYKILIIIFLANVILYYIHDRIWIDIINHYKYGISSKFSKIFWEKEK